MIALAAIKSMRQINGAALMIKITIFIIIFNILILPSNCFNIPGDAVKPSQVTRYEEIEIPENPPSGSGRGKESIRFYPSMDKEAATVSVKKEFIRHDYNYYPKYPLGVKVEVKILGKKLKDLKILEYIDKDLHIDSISNCILIDDMRDISSVDTLYTKTVSKKNNFNKIIEESIKNNRSKFAKFRDNYSIYNYTPNDNLIEYDVNDYYKWTGKSRFIYWYNITPKEIGIFKTRTIARSSGEFADVDEILEIQIVDPIPVFSVDADVEKLETECNVPMKVIYNLRYLGGASDPYSCNIILGNGSYKLEDEESYINNILKNKSFKLYEKKSIPINLSWDTSSKYYLPSINVVDKYNHREYPTNFSFKQNEIVVQNFWEIYKEIIYWVLLVATLIFGSIFNRDINRFIKKYYKKYRRKRKYKSLDSYP